MSKLKIPDGLLDKIYQAVDEQIGWTAHAERAISIAAPLIVAAELRYLADALSTKAREMRDEDERGIRSSALSVGIIHLRARADELDPQGVTK